MREAIETSSERIGGETAAGKEVSGKWEGREGWLDRGRLE